MANRSVAQSINRQTVAALTQARIEAAEHKAWMNAINRPTMNLATCAWVFDGEVLRIASASGNMCYTVTVKGCTCTVAVLGRLLAPRGVAATAEGA